VDARFLTYLVVAAVLIVTPGPDMALVARNAVRGGYPAARSTAFGVGAGILLWGMFSMAGLASALAASAAVFSTLKIAGAAFLVALGLRSLWAAARPKEIPETDQRAPLGGHVAFLQGLLGNLLNPKPARFS
jgi:threonine/homoserine/homoserine lactone efflux protein